jgi:hypothetical protein
MNDPYNSYGSNVAPLTPAAVEAKKTWTPPDPVARANVSESWKRRFYLIRKAGGADLPHFKDLTFGERFRLSGNVLAFLFGPIYFAVKGLYRQAIAFFVLSLVALVILEMIGMGRSTRAVGFALAAFYSTRANVSYYRLMIDREAKWF